jgi:hypothetical protein
MTTTWPHLTGTDGLRATLNAPLPPFDHRRRIHTVPLIPTSRTPVPISRTPAPKRLRCLAMKTRLFWVGLYLPPSPRNMDCRRQAATARVSQFDIAALTNAKYHGGGEGYYPLTPACRNWTK